jgi:acyl phosphate:glycerol-3-phosphate acyltransferase
VSDAARLLAAIAVGYLLGTLPSADLVTRLATHGRVDIRSSGTGNPGAANAIKVIGTGWGLVVLVLDIAKGTAAGLLGWAVGGTGAAYAAGTAAIAGHILPVWTGFRGGKGVATSAGTCLAVFPAYFPIDVVVAGASALRSHRADLTTRAACVIWVASSGAWWIWGLPNLWGPDPTWALPVFAVAGSTMILWKFAASARAAARAASA